MTLQCQVIVAAPCDAIMMKMIDWEHPRHIVRSSLHVQSYLSLHMDVNCNWEVLIIVCVCVCILCISIFYSSKVACELLLSRFVVGE